MGFLDQASNQYKIDLDVKMVPLPGRLVGSPLSAIVLLPDTWLKLCIFVKMTAFTKVSEKKRWL